MTYIDDNGKEHNNCMYNNTDVEGFAKKMDELRRKSKADPTFARRYLTEMGVLDETGELHEWYRNEGEEMECKHKWQYYGAQLSFTHSSNDTYGYKYQKGDIGSSTTHHRACTVCSRLESMGYSQLEGSAWYATYDPTDKEEE